jgi:hypothetical protein
MGSIAVKMWPDCDHAATKVHTYPNGISVPHLVSTLEVAISRTNAGAMKEFSNSGPMHHAGALSGLATAQDTQAESPGSITGRYGFSVTVFQGRIETTSASESK